ncbi:hypothetical protein [Enterococcus casseliflavus]|uniref:hypothetical protein n=1 Tax=Enterococcus casseliflavus TaxID=37734 RepID=UPI00119F2399|nr:hypothetical protein [Enterococcus casseliflavus]
MYLLTNAEYQVMLKIYEINEMVSKNELLKLAPELNENTTSVVLGKLLNYGYLEVANVIKKQTALSRVYKTSMPFLTFIVKELEIQNIDEFIFSTISKIEDPSTLKIFLDKINQSKEKLQKY